MLPSAGRKRPAVSRNSEDFPDPFGPTKAKACPDDNSRLTSLNTLRNPRTQPRPVAESRIIPRRPGACRRPTPAQPNKLCATHGSAALQSVATQPKSPYKPVCCVGRQTSSRAAPSRNGRACAGRVLRLRLVRWDGKGGHDLARQCQVRQDPRGRGQVLYLLQPT